MNNSKLDEIKKDLNQVRYEINQMESKIQPTLTKMIVEKSNYKFDCDEVAVHFRNAMEKLNSSCDKISHFLLGLHPDLDENKRNKRNKYFHSLDINKTKFPKEHNLHDRIKSIDEYEYLKDYSNNAKHSEVPELIMNCIFNTPMKIGDVFKLSMGGVETSYLMLIMNDIWIQVEDPKGRIINDGEFGIFVAPFLRKKKEHKETNVLYVKKIYNSIVQILNEYLTQLKFSSFQLLDMSNRPKFYYGNTSHSQYKKNLNLGLKYI